MSLRISEVARAAGVNRETLRYYERRGLIDEPARSPGGHRVYDDGAVQAVRVIKAAQRLGFTLDEVADVVALGRRRRRDPGLQSRAQAKLREVEARMEDLAAIRDNLTAALDAGCDDLDDCATNGGCPLPFTAGIDRRPGRRPAVTIYSNLAMPKSEQTRMMRGLRA